jgi:hypothetical protein
MHLVTPTAVDIARTLMHINVVCFLRRQVKTKSGVTPGHQSNADLLGMRGLHIRRTGEKMSPLAFSRGDV